MNQTSAPLAAEISEIDTFGIETIASQTVAVPAIKAAPIRMEARLHQYVLLLTMKVKLLRIYSL